MGEFFLWYQQCWNADPEKTLITSIVSFLTVFGTIFQFIYIILEVEREAQSKKYFQFIEHHLYGVMFSMLTPNTRLGDNALTLVSRLRPPERDKLIKLLNKRKEIELSRSHLVSLRCVFQAYSNVRSTDGVQKALEEITHDFHGYKNLDPWISLLQRYEIHYQLLLGKQTDQIVAEIQCRKEIVRGLQNQTHREREIKLKELSLEFSKVEAANRHSDLQAEKLKLEIAQLEGSKGIKSLDHQIKELDVQLKQKALEKSESVDLKALFGD